MPTLGEVRSHAARLESEKDVAEALRLYYSIARSQPLEYRARLKVADCLASLGKTDNAAEIYRATAFYCIKAGHPLTALVAARVVSETFHGEDSDILASLVAHYGSESQVTGPFAARLGLPPPEAEVTIAPETGAGLITAAAVHGVHATDDYEGFPEVLHEVPLLSEMSEEALKRVISTLVVRRLPAGATIIREGEPGQSFFFLADGRVSVFDIDSMGARRELAKLGPGAVFGEMALLSAKPRSASVVTLTEADLLEATRESLAALAEELPAVAAALQRFTYDRMLQNLMIRNPLFRPFTRAQQRDLLRRFTSHDVAPGTVIINEGDPGTGLFLVLSGAVEVAKGGGDESTPLATLRTGEVFGEMSLLRQEAATATVVASEQSTVLFLSRDYVDRMVANIPAVREYLAALAEDRELDTQLALASDDEVEDDGSVVIFF